MDINDIINDTGSPIAYRCFIESDNELAQIKALAPSIKTERLIYYESERRRIYNNTMDDPANLITVALTRNLLADGWRIGEHTAGAYRRHATSPEAIDNARVWYWTTGFRLLVITAEINKLRDIIPGIADALADYITGATDAVLTFIIHHKRLPDGANTPGWISTKNNAARFAYLADMNCHQFNDCFAHSFKDLGRQDINKIKTGKTSAMDKAKDENPTGIYRIWRDKAK